MSALLFGTTAFVSALLLFLLEPLVGRMVLPLLGGSAGGTWKLHVYDPQVGGQHGPGVLKSARITLHTTGGPERVARTASWTSPLLALPSDVLLVRNATWDARLPDGAAVSVQARSCGQSDCSHAAWVPVTPLMRI